MQAVREGVKAIVVDAPKQGLMSKLFARGAPPVPLSRHVVELVTSREVGRVYNLAPATIAMPPPMTAAAALANAAGSKPLYLFGWPFPVPAIDGIEEEADVAADFAADRLPAENFDQWRDVLATAVAAEKATHTYPVTTLVDSTGQLPQRVYLRTTPCELAIVSMEDKDLCYAALPYNDLVKWDCPVEAEIHVTARTRARLVAKPDRSGFSSQRPTRSTCHFVFKCTQAKAIISVIDNHLRALAKQLSNLGDGADEAEVAAAALSEVSLADEDEPAAAPAKAEEAKSIAKKPAPAPSSKRAVADDDDEDEAPKKSSKSKSSSRSRDDDEDEAPKKSVRGACCPSACRRCLSIACPRIPPSPTSSYARRPTPTTPPPMRAHTAVEEACRQRRGGGGEACQEGAFSMGSGGGSAQPLSRHLVHAMFNANPRLAPLPPRAVQVLAVARRRRRRRARQEELPVQVVQGGEGGQRRGRRGPQEEQQEV